MTLTPEIAERERSRLLDNVRFHRNEAKAAKRALDDLEATCNRLGIRLIREPKQTHSGEHREPQRPDHR